MYKSTLVRSLDIFDFSDIWFNNFLNHIFADTYKLTALLYLDKFRISSHSAGLPAI